jgi:hypothetical protein
MLLLLIHYHQLVVLAPQLINIHPLSLQITLKMHQYQACGILKNNHNLGIPSLLSQAFLNQVFPIHLNQTTHPISGNQTNKLLVDGTVKLTIIHHNNHHRSFLVNGTQINHHSTPINLIMGVDPPNLINLSLHAYLSRITPAQFVQMSLSTPKTPFRRRKPDARPDPLIEKVSSVIPNLWMEWGFVWQSLDFQSFFTKYRYSDITSFGIALTLNVFYLTIKFYQQEYEDDQILKFKKEVMIEQSSSLFLFSVYKVNQLDALEYLLIFFSIGNTVWLFYKTKNVILFNQPTQVYLD